MAIPTVLDNLLDYVDLNRRAKRTGVLPTYIHIKRGKKEEAWAVCSMLGMIIDRNFKIGGHPTANTFVFAKQPDIPYFSGYFAIGIGTRFHLRDLQNYFDKHEVDNET